MVVEMDRCPVKWAISALASAVLVRDERVPDPRVEDGRTDLVGVVGVAHAVEPQLAPGHGHRARNGVHRWTHRRHDRPMPDEVGVDDVHEDGHRRAPSSLLDDGDHSAGEGSAVVEHVHVEHEWVMVVHDAEEHRMGRASGVMREGLRAGHDGLGQQLAAVDHPAASPVADPGEPTVAGRLDVEDLEHPGQR